MKSLRSLVAAAAILACIPAVQATTDADRPSFVYPQERMFGAHKAILYAPQIESWPDFARFEGVMALQFYPDGSDKPLLASAAISGATEIDLSRRLVLVTDAAIDSVRFAARDTAAYEKALRDGVRKGRLEVPLDLFLLSLDESILDRPPPAGFSREPPAILVSRAPAIVLFIDGKPVPTELADTGLKLVVNANWPLIADEKAGAYYLLDREIWLTAKDLDGPWTPTRTLPAGLSKLPKDGEHAMIAAAIPAPGTHQRVSSVHHRAQPTELIVLAGEPQLEEIEGTGGLSFAANTDAALFRLGDRWFFPTAGRWFSSPDPFKGPWTFVETLPAAFAKIPADHRMGFVRATVRGTLEAKIAALEALLPKRNIVATDAKPGIEVQYAGEPQFQRIETTQVSRAVNTGYDVILFGNTYYLCYAGVWYAGVTPTGPWKVATSLPPELFAIPPSSPSYPVTQVTVVQATPTTVVYSQTPAYSSNVYVVYGVPWYGTGYYYYPYAWGHYYYPYPIAYGHGTAYNPATGAFASRSVWYGPYGGYSYTRGYNPRTGRYGYVETAWDGDEWASHGETYNPRTGVETETRRYYNEDSNKGEMERTVERGDAWIRTERETDFDKGTSTTTRTTSRGGSSEITRQVEDGQRTTSGTIETGGGRTATIEGSGDGSRGRMTVAGSEGGSAMAGYGEGGRAVAVRNAEGDLYAGHDGSVYRRTDDGWQSYDPDSGSWQAMQRPERSADPSRTGSPRPAAGGDSARDYSRLERDAATRHSGMSSFDRNRRAGSRGFGESRPRRR